MALLFNMLSRLVITFLPRNKRLLISPLQSPLQWFWHPQKSSLTDCIISPSICCEVMEADAMSLVSSSFLSAIRVMSFAYLRLLIFLPAILIPACASPSPAFLMMYSAHKLNKQGDNMQPWHPDLEPVCCSMSSSNCCFLTCIQISQKSGCRSRDLVFPTLYEFPTVYCDPHSQRLWIVNKAEVDVYLLS